MTDSYAGEVAEKLSKQIGQNFCSILWNGAEEHDVSQIFYYYNQGQNLMSQLSKAEDSEVMTNISKSLVGMFQVSTKLTGSSVISGFPTQLFCSDKQLTIVRCIFPYHIIISCNMPVSEQCIVRTLDMITLITFSYYDPSIASFVPHSKDALIPSAPTSSFAVISQLLNSFLFRFFEDELSREFLLNYQPVLLPRDIVSVQLYALQLLKRFKDNQAVCVLFKNRVLLSNQGPFMTTFFQLLTSNSNESFLNRRFHYCFGNLFKAQNPETVNEHIPAEFQNLAKTCYQTVFISVFLQGNASLCVVGLQPLQNFKQNQFNQQLIMLSDKMQSFGATPPVYAKLGDTFLPLFMPIQGNCDVCATDAAGLFRAFRGVQTTQVNPQSIDYGSGNIDGGLLSYFVTRDISQSECVYCQDEFAESRYDVKSEFNSFQPNPGLSMGGFISGIPRILPKVYCSWRSDGIIRAAGACPDYQSASKQIQQLQEVYCRVAKVDE